MRRHRPHGRCYGMYVCSTVHAVDGPDGNAARVGAQRALLQHNWAQHACGPAGSYTVGRYADLQDDRRAHCDGAELLVEGDAGAQRVAVERDHALAHGEAATSLGLSRGDIEEIGAIQGRCREI